MFVYLQISSQCTCLCVSVGSFVSISNCLSRLFTNCVVEEREVTAQFRNILISIDCCAVVQLDNIHCLRDNRDSTCDNGQLPKKKASINRPLSLTVR